MIKHKSEKERISKLYEHKKGEFNTLKYAHEKAQKEILELEAEKCKMLV